MKSKLTVYLDITIAYYIENSRDKKRCNKYSNRYNNNPLYNSHERICNITRHYLLLLLNNLGIICYYNKYRNLVGRFSHSPIGWHFSFCPTN